MDKHTTWMSWILLVRISLGLGGTYYGQGERIDVLHQELNEKDTHIQALNSKIAQSESQIKKQEQKITELQRKFQIQQKNISEIQKNANF